MEIQEIENQEFLAKGKRGVVWTGYCKVAGRRVKVALKVKREDSQAIGRIEIEAKFLQLLNKHGIGPKFVGSGKDFLVYEFLKMLIKKR